MLADSPPLLSKAPDGSVILDVAAYSFGDPDIERHVHLYNKAVPETLARQRRVARKWQLTRHAIHDRMRWSRERIRDWQLSSLSRLVDFAFSTIPFYRALYSACGFRPGDIVTWEDFSSLPIITRRDLTTDFPAAHVLAGVDPAKCYGARTSGSSGVPLSIVRDDGSEELQSLLRMRQFEVMLGEALLPTDWIYNIYLSSWAFTSFAGALPVFSISEDCPPAAILRHIACIRPKVVSAFPSFLSRMAMNPMNLLECGVRCICTNSEGSTRQERDTFAALFGVPVLDEYATEEMSGVIASECREGHYHVVEDRVVVEVANVAPDGTGDIIVTDLANLYMPIIRYAQGDLIVMSPDNARCVCANNFRFLARFLGRADQALYSPSIGRVPSDRLMNLCDRTFVSQESGVAAFRLIQNERDSVDVLLVLRAGLQAVEPRCLELFSQGLREIFQYQIRIKVSYVEALPDRESYKRRAVINQLDTIHRGSDTGAGVSGGTRACSGTAT
jgi:phenylacetate-CoA ligase